MRFKVVKALAIEILDYANELERVGVPKEQAEQHARLFARITEEHLATKADIRNLKHDIDFKIAKLKNQLLVWYLSISAAQAAIIISCIKLSH